MSEQANATNSAQKYTRPFPWFCPKCRHQEVWRVTIPYECERTHERELIYFVIPNLSVPRCANCGELVFDYDAEDQINSALRERLHHEENARHQAEQDDQKRKTVRGRRIDPGSGGD
jgi:hypothetical protein